MKNLEDKIQILNENRGEETLFDYVSNQCEPDPNFFRWLFDEEFEKDFNSSLTEPQQAEFDAWLLDIKKQSLLEKWIVVKMNFSEDEEICVTRRSNFKEMYACEAYGNYGQIVGCENAGCYALDNSSSSAKSDLIASFVSEFNINPETVNTDELFEFFPINRQYPGTPDFISTLDLDKIIAFETKWIEENEHHTEITGWTYWDGNNHETLTLKDEFSETNCTELEDDEQLEILLEMPESTPYISGTNTSEETENFTFLFDRWASNPWYCYVERK